VSRNCMVVGGRLVGLSAAIALSRFGMDVTVFERSPARAVDGAGAWAWTLPPGYLPDARGAFGRYQELRPRPAAQHVAASERATAAYLAHATQ
jgi:glycine/D-amino acid oxidase-like deaminating enzyme